MNEAMKKMEEFGANGVIEKPFKLDEFEVIFKRLENKL